MSSSHRHMNPYILGRLPNAGIIQPEIFKQEWPQGWKNTPKDMLYNLIKEISAHIAENCKSRVHSKDHVFIQHTTIQHLENLLQTDEQFKQHYDADAQELRSFSTARQLAHRFIRVWRHSEHLEDLLETYASQAKPKKKLHALLQQLREEARIFEKFKRSPDNKIIVDQMATDTQIQQGLHEMLLALAGDGDVQLIRWCSEWKNVLHFFTDKHGPGHMLLQTRSCKNPYSKTQETGLCTPYYIASNHNLIHLDRILNDGLHQLQIVPTDDFLDLITGKKQVTYNLKHGYVYSNVNPQLIKEDIEYIRQMFVEDNKLYFTGRYTVGHGHSTYEWWELNQIPHTKSLSSVFEIQIPTSEENTCWHCRRWLGHCKCNPDAYCAGCNFPIQRCHCWQEGDEMDDMDYCTDCNWPVKYCHCDGEVKKDDEYDPDNPDGFWEYFPEDGTWVFQQPLSRRQKKRLRQ